MEHAWPAGAHDAVEVTTARLDVAPEAVRTLATWLSHEAPGEPERIISVTSTLHSFGLIGAIVVQVRAARTIPEQNDS